MFYLLDRKGDFRQRLASATLPKLSVDSAEQLLGTVSHVTPNNPTQTPTTADANRTPTELPIAAGTPDIYEQTFMKLLVGFVDCKREKKYCSLIKKTYLTQNTPKPQSLALPGNPVV